MLGGQEIPPPPPKKRKGQQNQTPPVDNVPGASAGSDGDTQSSRAKEEKWGDGTAEACGESQRRE